VSASPTGRLVDNHSQSMQRMLEWMSSTQLQAYWKTLPPIIVNPRPKVPVQPVMTWAGTLRGRIGKPYNAFDDDIVIQNNPLHVHMAPALHDLGLMNKTAFLKLCGRQRDRFIVKAMKRARSNHPHNIKWKPLLGVYTAYRVALALEC
jgi:hypothetical protein